MDSFHKRPIHGHVRRGFLLVWMKEFNLLALNMPKLLLPLISIRLDGIFGPFSKRADGTLVFTSPIGDKGTIPLIALDDLGWWVRYIFDNSATTTGRNLEIASQVATFPDIVEAFRRVTGLSAVYRPLSMDDYFALWNGKDVPVASAVPNGKTWEDNFRAFFAMWRDGKFKRNMEWIASVHSPTSVEQWMRESKYTGAQSYSLLKNVEDRTTPLRHNPEALAKL